MRYIRHVPGYRLALGNVIGRARLFSQRFRLLDYETELFAFKGNAPPSLILGFIARMPPDEVLKAEDRFLSRIERIPRRRLRRRQNHPHLL